MTEEIARMQEELLANAEKRRSDSNIARAQSRRIHVLESMMETVPVGVVLADADGQIIYGNKHVETMVRHPILFSDDVDSYGEWIAYHADGRRVESHDFPLSRVLRERDPRSELDVHYQRGDGSRFWMRIIGEPILDSENELLGATVALIDIDEELRLQNAQRVLIAELNHRVKNAFSVVKSIVSQSLRKVSVDSGLRDTVNRRLDAYASAHSKLIGSSWETAPLKDVALEVLGPIGGDQVKLEGPVIELPSRQALAFSMAFYELATNALKYGSLSELEGRVDLFWNLTDNTELSQLEICWIERGGPVPSEPSDKGFGSFITGRALEAETSGRVTSEFLPTGYEWKLRMPIQKEEIKNT